MLEHINSEWGKAWVSSQFHARRGVFVPLVYIDINEGSLTDALVFAQIMYWHEPNKETGKSRLRIFQDGQWWMAKNHADWYDETRINKRTVRTCLDRIRDRGLIVYELRGMAGKKTPFIRVNWPVFEREIKAAMASEERRKGPDISGQGSDMDGHTPDISGQGGVQNRSGGGTKKVKPNTEIFIDNNSKGTETNEPAWMNGPVPIPRLLLLPPPKVDASEAIQFFEKNIDAVNPHLREVIEAACQQYGLVVVLDALRYAAEHKAKRWAYVQTRLEGQAQASAEQVAREAAHREIMAESAVDTPPLNPLPKADEAGLAPTIPEALAVVCPGHGGTAAKTWDTVQYLLESQLDRGTFNTYVRDLVLTDYQAETVTFVVAAQSGHVRDVCAHRLGRHVRKLLGEVCEQAVQVEFVFEQIERGAA